MAEYDHAKQLWRRQVGAREELPWTRGAIMLEVQPAFFLGAAVTGGIGGTLGGWLTAVIVLAFGAATAWIDRLQLPDSLRRPPSETAWTAIIPVVYLLRRSATFAAAGVPRPRLPLWVFVGLWLAAAIVWAVLSATTGLAWAFYPWW